MSQNITKTSDSNDHESQAWNTTLKASPPGWHRSDGFLEFSLFSFILGLDLKALTFSFFCVKTKEMNKTLKINPMTTLIAVQVQKIVETTKHMIKIVGTKNFKSVLAIAKLG